MKSNSEKFKINKIAIVITLALFIITGVSYIFSFERLPKGEYIETSVSPNGEYSVTTYLCNSGATTD